MTEKQKIQIEYLVIQAKSLINDFGSKNLRWTEKLERKIDKVITVRDSLVEMSQIIHNENLHNSMDSLDKYLIDLEYLKKYDVDIGQSNGYKSYKDFAIRGKNKSSTLCSDYNFNNEMNNSMMFTTITEHKKTISKKEIIGLLREILLRLNIDEKDADTTIKQEFGINNKKFENIKYKIIYANGNFLSLPLQDLKTEYDYDIYIATMVLEYPNAKEEMQKTEQTGH